MNHPPYYIASDFPLVLSCMVLDITIIATTFLSFLCAGALSSLHDSARPKLGRSRIDPALEKRIQAHLRGGKGIRKVARECGVGTGTVQRIRQEMDGPFVGVAA
jgi:hypothetical protein